MQTFKLTLSLAVLIAGSASAQSTYKIENSFAIGGDGGWDYVVPDSSQHRLFIARQTHVLVVDENTGKLVGEVSEIHGAHGTALAPGTGHGFATSSEDKSVVMFDTATLKNIKRIPAAEDADAILFDNKSGRVFSLNGDAASTTVIDAKSGDVVKNLKLGGKPEYGAIDGTGKLYVNLVDKNEIIEIDTNSLEITRQWPTTNCQLPVSLAIDTTHHRLFSGCRSGVLAVSDYEAGKVIATLPIGKGVDGAGYDPASGNAFASGGDGTLTVVHQDTPDTYRVVQTLTTPLGARTMGLDPANHKVFLVSAKFGPTPAGARRGPVLPGSFSLIVVNK